MSKIKILQGDITKVDVEAIVNAANTSLLGGGGVDGAIHRAGGSQILDECRAIRARQGGCDPGEAVITNAGNLPALKVIHTVGPVWTGDNEGGQRAVLASCYLESLRLAVANNLRTIAFPNISTGVYRFPKDIAAQTAFKTVQEFLSENDAIDEVIFVCFDIVNFNLYQKLLDT